MNLYEGLEGKLKPYVCNHLADQHRDVEISKLPPGQTMYAEFWVPPRYVKRVKTELENMHRLNKTRKIVPSEAGSQELGEPAMSVYSTISFGPDIEQEFSDPRDLKYGQNWVSAYVHHLYGLFAFWLTGIAHEIKTAFYTVHEEDNWARENNPVVKALRIRLEALPPEMLASIGISVEQLISSFPASYTTYRPMLLLPHNACSSPPWTKFLQAYPLNSPIIRSFWEKLTKDVGRAHSINCIAINAGIPLQTASSNENTLRSPANLTPLHGSFGPPPTAQTLSSPTEEDFREACWVSHRQNGIEQVWAPLYTMFSRGNIREKTRLLTLPSVKSAAEPRRGCTAVDLYAGIGYFAFSYKKAKVKKVLCWELNPWSVEGLARGAGRNDWTTHVVDPSFHRMQRSTYEADFVVFAHSNERAVQDLAELRRDMDIPPVRHVNCGLLPTSKLSWGTAVGMVDRHSGGWIHAHENVGVNDIEGRREEVVREMQGYVDLVEKACEGQKSRDVRCEHVERVKTYAPGVVHVVFDVWIAGVLDIVVD